MVGVELDPTGRLIRFEAVPSPATAPTADGRLPDSEALFAEAALDRAAFAPTEPRFLPPFYADARTAWAEGKPERADRPLRVEAATHRGCPVYFELDRGAIRHACCRVSRRPVRPHRRRLFLASFFTVPLVGGPRLPAETCAWAAATPGAIRGGGLHLRLFHARPRSKRTVGNVFEYPLSSRVGHVLVRRRPQLVNLHRLEPHPGRWLTR
jgi:hypothetical protein